ncbi:ATP-binding protein [Saccharothrix sp. Mg75]|uniref:ATP-binding protein n=1 Tax=Saccharothrix sp. Mg75 TaxID=3445357 RepID=UPI003EE96068
MTDDMTLDLGDLKTSVRMSLPAGSQPGTGERVVPVDTAATTVQHRLETIQLVNWGGFEGRQAIDLDRDSTLMSGASGTGKSTIQDAWLALLQPSDTPFNGASNDAVRGRARSAEQRNVLSYLRGQIDTTEGDDGQDRAKVLRGDGTDTWAAVGATFVDDHGRRFTAFRLYYAGARVTRSPDVLCRMFTFDGVVNLAEFAPLAALRPPFPPAQVKATVPGTRHHESYSSFSQTLFTRLGIGANGDGGKALRLLARVQAGQQIRTVDELYKEMVLERPGTYDDADRAVEHFNALEDAYLTMRVEQQKAELLAPIKQWWADLERARTEVGLIDTLGLALGQDSPVGLWALRTERELLAEAVQSNTARCAQAGKALADARRIRSEQERELTAAQVRHDAAGGGRLRQIGLDIEEETARRRDRDTRRATLAGAISALDAHLAGGLGSRQDYDTLHEASTAFLTAVDATAAGLQQRRDRLKQEEHDLLRHRTRLREDRASYAGRAGRVPPWLDALRRQVADAAGFAHGELPFLAELVDVVDGQQQWRTAIETVLGSSARLLLVPADRLERFSRAIDPLHLSGRITFQGAPVGPWDPARTASVDRDRVAGKLQFKDSPFTSWVFEHVTDASRNALCVPTAADLAGHGYRVTPAGQTRQGWRGSHGRSDQHNIIGFSNADTLTAIDTQLGETDTALKSVTTRIGAVETEQSTLRARASACEAVTRVRWDDIDVPGSDELIARLRAEQDSILNGDDRLRALQAHIESLTTLRDKALREEITRETREEELAEQGRSLAARQEQVNGELLRLQRQQRVVLTEEQAAHLDREFTATTGERVVDLDHFTTGLAALHKRLVSRLDHARQQVNALTRHIEDRFEQYQRIWEDPNLGRTLASYADYERVHDGIQATGLHERRNEWRRRLTDWSGEDLVPLAHSMGDAIEEIERRLEPINTILRSLPFGANANRLRIRMRRQRFEHVTAFRRELSRLSSTATKQFSDEALEKRFKDLQAFMHQIRTKDDPRGLATARAATGTQAVGRDRDQLLDVRKHVTITAECYETETERLISKHASLGGKSGGESQELIAFIVGAALRFRLGDELRERPRFAPVFLDEGFIKSDAEFAGRAVRAWQGLGFQLVISAPLDKVTGLEPHMNELLAITKNTRTHYSFLHPITDRQAFRNAVAALAPSADERTAGLADPPATARAHRDRPVGQVID